jgi:lactoylglutathione lyase
VDGSNVRQVIPFLSVQDMERSLRYYLDGLGFTMTHKWVVEGKIRWCCLALGEASVMLQEFAQPQGKAGGDGVTLMFICQDAVRLWGEFRSQGIEASEPQVGNAMWVTSLTDPDGYRIDFESDTDAPEEMTLSEYQASRQAGQ